MYTIRGHFKEERGGTPFPLLKRLGPPKMHFIAGVCVYNIKLFSRVIPPDPRCAWTRTPISAWLPSVCIVTVLRNDHWCRPTVCMELRLKTNIKYNELLKKNNKTCIHRVTITSFYHRRTVVRPVLTAISQSNKNGQTSSLRPLIESKPLNRLR